MVGKFNDRSKSHKIMETNISNKVNELSPKAKQLLIEKIKIALNNNTSKSTSKNERIAAYVKSNENIDTAKLKEGLKGKLPDYMIPSLIFPVDEIPILPNGKINRSLLQQLHTASTAKSTKNLKKVSVKNNTESKLTKIWEETLGFSPIKTTDNFFEIGGDSILSIQIVTKAKKEGFDFQSNDIFKHQTIEELALLTHSQTSIESNATSQKEVSPQNTKIQDTLITIWEETLGFSPIKTTDNFFEIGGDSILSIQIVTKAKNNGIVLESNAIFEYQTIAELSQMISSKNSKKQSWKYVVPISNKGTKNPLFCIHAGGGHAFTYKNLSRNMDSDRPLYAIQTKGTYQKNNMHDSIAEMSQDYADEIIQVQPTGVVNVLVYCFSTCVGLEIAAYLKTKSRETNIIVADTIADHRLLLDKSRLMVRISFFLKRFFKNPYETLKVMIAARAFLYFRPLLVKISGSEEEKNAVNVMFHLEKLLNKYDWNTKAETISLLLTKKIEPNYNKAIYSSWEHVKMGTKKTSIVETDGNHATLFDYPDVKKTAEGIEKLMIDV